MSTLSKLYSLAILVLSLASGFLFWQHNSLVKASDENREHCEQEIAALLARQKAQSQVNHDTDLKPASSTGQLEKPVALAPSELVELTKADEKPQLRRYNESLDDIVRRKYRFLLSRLELSEAEIEELVQLLRRREKIQLKLQDAEEFADELEISMREIADLRFQLEQLDEEIEALIGDAEVSRRFALLKDSDKEQEEFSQYTLGINGLFPLSREQQEKVLLTRLEHKQRFDEVIEETGVNQDFPLTYAQQQEMLSKIDYALFNYKNAYLAGVKPHLQHDESAMNQYALLENYTNTEFEQMQKNLRQQVEKRGLIDPLPLSQNQ